MLYCSCSRSGALSNLFGIGAALRTNPGLTGPTYWGALTRCPGGGPDTGLNGC